LSSDAAYAAAVQKGAVKVFDLRHPGKDYVVPLPEGVGRADLVALSPGGRYLVVSHPHPDFEEGSEQASVLELPGGKAVARIPGGAGMKINDLAFGPSGNLAVGGRDFDQRGRFVGRVFIWTLAERLRAGESTAHLTAADFERPVSVAQDQEVFVVAPGLDDTLLATQQAVWKLGAGREYEPAARLPALVDGPRHFIEVAATGRIPPPVLDVAFGAEGDRLTVARGFIIFKAGSKKVVTSLEVWEAAARAETARAALPAPAREVGFEPGGRAVAVALGSPESHRGVLRFDAGNGGKTPAQMSWSGSLLYVSLDDGHSVTADHDARVAQVWSGWGAKSVPAPYAPELGRASGAALTPDGKFLVLLGERGEGGDEDKGGGAKEKRPVACFYSLAGGAYRLERAFATVPELRTAVLTPDGAALVLLSKEDRATVQRTEDGSEAALPGLSAMRTIAALQVSPDGRLLAAAGRIDGPYVLRVWRLADGRQHLPDTSYPVSSLTFSRRGNYLLASSIIRRPQLLDLSGGGWRALPDGGQVSTAAFSDDERLLAVGTAEGFVAVYRTEAPDGEIARLRHDGQVDAVSFDEGGNRLATASRQWVPTSDRPRPYHRSAEEGFSLHVWSLRREDLLAEADARLKRLPPYIPR
jgi:hypothetical protein